MSKYLKKKGKEREGRDRREEGKDVFTMCNYEYFGTTEKLKYHNKYLDHYMVNLV